MKRNYDFLNHFFKQEELNNDLISDVKYVAIGDSFCTGLSSKFGFFANGKLENGEITGLGYPSFLANLIKQNNKTNLISFDNLAMVSSHFQLWTALIQNDHNELKKYTNHFDILKQLDWNVKNPFRNFFSNYFKNWNIKKDDFLIIQQKIKEANLITINLGLDDILYNLPFKYLKSLRRIEEKEEILNLIENDIKELIKTKKTEYLSLIKTIKFHNPNANLYLINYPYVVNYFASLIDRFYDLDFYFTKKATQLILEAINYMTKKVAREMKIGYLNVFDEEYFENKHEYLNENIFSIFPTDKLHKKIAMDLFIKLSINKSKFNLENLKTEFVEKYLINKNYWFDDLFSYKQLFDNQTNEGLIKFVFGRNLNYNLFINNELENKYKKILKPYLNIYPIIESYVKFGTKNIPIIVSQMIEQKFKNQKEKYPSILKTLEYLKDETRSKEIFLTLFKNGKLEKILYMLQQQVFKEKLKNNITIKELKNGWKEILNSDQKPIYDVLKQFFDSKVIEESKIEIKELFKSLIDDALNTDILEFVFGFKNNKHYSEIRSYLSSLESFKEVVYFIVENVTNYAQLYSKLNTFDELWKNFIIKNKFNLIKHFDEIFIEISNENNIENTINFIIETIKTSIRVTNLNPKEEKDLKEDIKYIILTLKDNTKHLNNMFVKFIDKVKNYSLYDLIVKKETKQKIFKLNNWISLFSFLFLASKIGRRFLNIKRIINKNKI
ncbi:SGNH/GDSL hydrolase family protein [[Mycoplasma] anseris]|nr:SGNH/GDSL hydrolase family protein [[Mycoplasma] anseris]